MIMVLTRVKSELQPPHVSKQVSVSTEMYHALVKNVVSKKRIPFETISMARLIFNLQTIQMYCWDLEGTSCKIVTVFSIEGKGYL